MRAAIRCGAMAIALSLACGGAGEVWRAARPRVDGRLEVALPRLEQRVLPSKLTLISAQTSFSGLVRMSLVLRGGYGEDPEGKEGLASLTATLLRVLADAPANADRFGELGTTPLIDVGRRGLTVAIEVLPEDGLAAALALADFVREAAPDPSLLEFARAGRLAARAQLLASPDALAALAIAEQFPPARGTSRTLGLGTEATLAAITTQDVSAYLQRALDPSESALIVTGPVESLEAVRWAVAAFASWPKRPARPRPADHGRVVTRDDREVFVPMPGMRQTLIVVAGLRPLSVDPESVAFEAAVSALQFRIHLTLREELRVSYGIADGVQAEDGVFVVPIRVRADKTRVALSAIRTAMEAEYGLPSLDWLAHRRVSQSVRLMDASQDGPGIATHARDVFLHGRVVESLQDMLRALRTLDAAAVEGSMKSFLQPRSLRIVVVGDPDVVRPQLHREVDVRTPATLL